jgi:hypothetical protein
MFHIKFIKLNNKKNKLYVLSSTNKIIYYCSIYNIIGNKIEPEYILGGREKDTNYKLVNPSDIAINSNDDIAISEFDIGKIRIFDGSTYKFKTMIGGVEEIESNSSNENYENKSKTMQQMAFRVCSLGLKGVFNKFFKYSLNKITSIIFSKDNENIIIVDTFGIHLIKITNDRYCNIYNNKNQQNNLVPYKVNLLDDNLLISMIPKQNIDNIQYMSNDIYLFNLNGQILKKIKVNEFINFSIYNNFIYLLNEINIIKYDKDLENFKIISLEGTKLINILIDNNKLIVSNSKDIYILNIVDDKITNKVIFTNEIDHAEIINIGSNTFKDFKKKMKYKNIKNINNFKNLITKNEILNFINTLDIDKSKLQLLINNVNDLYTDSFEKAYKKIVLYLHPDKFKNSNKSKDINNIFIRITDLVNYKRKIHKKPQIIFNKNNENNKKSITKNSNLKKNKKSIKMIMY